jgi:gamma-glutamylcyclotransferase (GGCT)/AIG2-like uncharacterized protein YtfP
MRDRLFVYGSLLPGHEPAGMAAVCRRLNFLEPATIRGQLFDLGPYPGVIIGNGADGIVHGELAEVDCDDTWRALDQYEGCPRAGEGDGLFRRVRTVAALESGESVECWVYVYDRGLSRARRIEGGCWRTYRGLL